MNIGDYNPPINFRVILLATLRRVVQIAGQLSRAVTRAASLLGQMFIFRTISQPRTLSADILAA